MWWFRPFCCQFCCWMFATVCKLYVFCWLVDMQEVLDTVWHGFIYIYIYLIYIYIYLIYIYIFFWTKKQHHQGSGSKPQSKTVKQLSLALLLEKPLEKQLLLQEKTLNRRVFSRYLHLVNVYGLENVAKYAILWSVWVWNSREPNSLRTHLRRDTWTCPICPWPRWGVILDPG